MIISFSPTSIQPVGSRGGDECGHDDRDDHGHHRDHRDHRRTFFICFFIFIFHILFLFPRLCSSHMLDCPLRRCSVDPADLTTVQADSKSPVVW